MSFHSTELPDAQTVSIQANSGKISLENDNSNTLTEIRTKGKNQFEWNQRSDTLFISIPATAENEFEIALKSGQKLEILSQTASFNLIQLSNHTQITSQNSNIRLDQPPQELVITSRKDSVFAGLTPETKYHHQIEMDSSYFRLIKNGNETEIFRNGEIQDSAETKNSGILIIENGEKSEIEIKNVGRIW